MTHPTASPPRTSRSTNRGLREVPGSVQQWADPGETHIREPGGFRSTGLLSCAAGASELVRALCGQVKTSVVSWGRPSGRPLFCRQW